MGNKPFAMLIITVLLIVALLLSYMHKIKIEADQICEQRKLDSAFAPGNGRLQLNTLDTVHKNTIQENTFPHAGN